jgi:N6-L-threonylcarbamoyladenine synthase
LINAERLWASGPVIDKHAEVGNQKTFRFSKPVVKGLDFSFSGLKTNFLYFLRDRIKENPEFISENRADLCASLQYTIVSILTGKLIKASEQTRISEIGIAGGVSANSGLRGAVKAEAEKRNWNLYIPPLSYTTDNAAMIGITGYYKYIRGEFSSQDVTPLARL